MTFEILEHTAEVGLCVRATTLAEIFVDLAAGLFSLMTDPATVAARETWPVSLQAPDPSTLAVDWLNELLYLHDRDGMLAAVVDVARTGETFIEASVRGERFDPAKHDQRLEVKAATYHQLEVKRGDGGWTARVYLDI